MSQISTFICAISGEPLPTETPIVVTPSGYICSKTLLLTKLSENGGIDPFTSQPLSENELTPITTTTTSSNTITTPKLSTHTSFTSLLSSINTEYESLVLELFDTRKVLQETRKELSQALYQNDAAVRVIARLSMERDDARQKLASFDNIQPKEADVVEEDEQPSKKQKVETVTVTEEDVEILRSEWKTLSKSRKKRPIPDDYVTTDEMGKFKEVNKVSLHKSTSKPGVTAMKGYADLICTAGYDKHVIVYDNKSGSITTTLTGASKEVTYLDIAQVRNTEEYKIITASLDQNIRLYSINKQTEEETTKPIATLKLPEDAIIESISLHSTTQFILVTTETTNYFIKIMNDELKILKSFSSTDVKYNTAALHPDGLIYAIGTKDTHTIELWDLREQTLASTLPAEEGSITNILFSQNGYHIAVTTSSSTQISIFDLRKVKCIGTIETDGVVNGMSFDWSGKYLAYGVMKDGKGSIGVVFVKDQSVVSVLDMGLEVGFLVWSDVWGKSLAVGCESGDRFVRFVGVEEAKMEE